MLAFESVITTISILDVMVLLVGHDLESERISLIALVGSNSEVIDTVVRCVQEIVDVIVTDLSLLGTVDDMPNHDMICVVGENESSFELQETHVDLVSIAVSVRITLTYVA